MSAERDDAWPSIPTVLRVMAGWFLLGVGLLDLATGVDGPTYVLFHVVLALGGAILLALHRIDPSRAGYAAGALVAPVGLGLGLLPTTARCCLAWYPQRRGYPFPFLGAGGGTHVDARYLAADLVFWACAGLVAMAVVRIVERLRPERRTPVDVSGYVARHAEERAYVAQHRADENVGGLT
ncbi:hypothetical protein [Actinoplanes teichomyceticus]|uniref:Uncharacterized protein n=1 Tax=Actinoplanes teichomyceticus TaxID=1867 RepID=A0A561WPK9_ACTTI|nr:hypothetical protein [Actinoplanes teichomyceticus]TWG25773.1 hypothetical protein FHX34_101745 [Actinoplanes teichomyceticus]GIF10848.1 hypothetical protein Ate01nite_08800 [Actinoplanes teichomyceticus]